MNEKDAFEEKMDAKFREWRAKTEQLKAKKDQLDAEAKLEAERRIHELETKQESARQKLDELKLAGTDAWADLRTGVENAWSEISSAFESASTHFK